MQRTALRGHRRAAKLTPHRAVAALGLVATLAAAAPAAPSAAAPSRTLTRCGVRVPHDDAAAGPGSRYIISFDETPSFQDVHGVVLLETAAGFASVRFDGDASLHGNEFARASTPDPVLAAVFTSDAGTTIACSFGKATLGPGAARLPTVEASPFVASPARCAKPFVTPSVVAGHAAAMPEILKQAGAEPRTVSGTVWLDATGHVTGVKTEMGPFGTAATSALYAATYAPAIVRCEPVASTLDVAVRVGEATPSR